MTDDDNLYLAEENIETSTYECQLETYESIKMF